ncbi:MAG: aminoacyl-tRNA hydrolase [Acholeplasmatales bacterium]|nr:aminoacyl-tRNA hydrolase [Acholeplasmatales bacterium]
MIVYKLIVALGNYPPEYKNTRHNAGFIVLNYVTENLKISIKKEAKFNGFLGKLKIDDTCFLFLFPTTFMNNSGLAVNATKSYYKVEKENILVIVDDTMTSVGKIRLREQGSDGGHNGLKSVISVLGSKFNRIRIGINQSNKEVLADYVLENFSKVDLEIINNVVSPMVNNVINDYLKEIPFSDIMTKYNTLNNAQDTGPITK